MVMKDKRSRPYLVHRLGELARVVLYGRFAQSEAGAHLEENVAEANDLGTRLRDRWGRPVNPH
jgi:hypothetical protein